MPELTILMPCLNEAETLAKCIEKARLGLEQAGVDGEIVIADNGSTDDSQQIAEALGARVVPVVEKGYGSALRGGIAAARSPWILMGDADDSYDFSEIAGFVALLQEGHDLVMGCRLPSGGGTIMPGAMPWKNRWIGNPALSTIGRVFFKTPIQDFHCGLRAFTKAAYAKMDLQTTGMEFASEMVIKATLRGMRVAETPITLHKDGRSRPPHLKPWRDGWRHLRFMLIYSPRWLFLVPGLILLTLGLLAGGLIGWSPRQIGAVRLDAGTLMVAGMGVIIGLQLMVFAVLAKVFAISAGLLPADRAFARFFSTFSLERGVVVGALSMAAGLGFLLNAVWIWSQAHYGDLSASENLRRLIPAATLMVIGVQIISASFFASILGLKTVHHTPPDPEI